MDQYKGKANTKWCCVRGQPWPLTTPGPGAAPWEPAWELGGIRAVRGGCLAVFIGEESRWVCAHVLYRFVRQYD